MPDAKKRREREGKKKEEGKTEERVTEHSGNNSFSHGFFL